MSLQELEAKLVELEEKLADHHRTGTCTNCRTAAGVLDSYAERAIELANDFIEKYPNSIARAPAIMRMLLAELKIRIGDARVGGAKSDA